MVWTILSNVYFLMPKKIEYLNFYTKFNMRVGEVYIFDTRHTPHVSCKFKGAPENSLRGSIEFRFVISPK